MGRPGLLTAPSAVSLGQTIGQAIIQARGMGQSLELAAEGQGITGATAYDWQRRGRLAIDARNRGEEVPANEQPYAEFAEGLQTAWARGVLARIARITKAAAEGETTRTVVKEALDEQGKLVVIERTTTITKAPVWTADAWVLERTLPQLFGKRMEVTGADGAPLVPEQDRAAGLSAALAAFQAGEQARAELDAERTEAK